MKTYRLLKKIESDDSIDIRATFTVKGDYIDMDNGMKVPAKLLIEQGFIEEVKGASKPKYRVGDYAVDCEKRFVKIFSVSKNDDPRTYNEVYTGQ